MAVSKLVMLAMGCCLRSTEAFAPTVQQFARIATPTSPRINGIDTSLHASALSKAGIELAGVLYDSTSTAFDAWEWSANLGAPAALVAGAVLVTLSETRPAMVPRKRDKKWVRSIKLYCRLLLLSSFALEVISIFVSTVTGTVLLSHGEQVAAKAVGYTSPLALLHHHHEFEYLTIRIAFLQGLFHWLAAVALEMIIPKEGEGVTARKMNMFMASCLLSLILWMLAFYNHHISFYGNYGTMVMRYFALFYKRFFATFRPMSILYGPSVLVSAVLGWKAFRSNPELDND